MLFAVLSQCQQGMDSNPWSLDYESIFLPTCGLYYKPMTIINDDSRVINKLEASLTDNTRVVIYDRHMFIVQASATASWPISCSVCYNQTLLHYRTRLGEKSLKIDKRSSLLCHGAAVLCNVQLQGGRTNIDHRDFLIKISSISNLHHSKYE